MAAPKIWKKLENRYTFGRIESSTVMVSAYIYIYIYMFSHVVDVMGVLNFR